jgi:hypothetical protein
MSAKYERLPTSPNSPSPTSSRSPSPSEVTFPPLRSPSRMAREAERTRELQRQTDRDPRFNVPPPSAWKRVALLVFVGVLFWLSFYVRARPEPKPKVVYASRYVSFFPPCPSFDLLFSFHLRPFVLLHHPLSDLARLVPILALDTLPTNFMFRLEHRYSKEHKFRPAASPIITERLKDGRVRLRGAHAGL